MAKAAPPVASESEQEAILKCQRGDISGLKRLYETYRERVYRTCFRILASRSLAEESTQEIFVHVFHQIYQFRQESAFSSWLYRIAVNFALNKAGEESRRQAWAKDEEGKLQWVKTPELPDEALQQKEAVHLVQKALSRLSLEHRTVIVLREIEGLNYAEISEVLGIPTGTVMSRLARAREELQRKTTGLRSRNRE